MGFWFSPALAKWFVAYQLKDRSFTEEDAIVRVYVDDFGIKSSTPSKLRLVQTEIEQRLAPLTIVWSPLRKIMDVKFAGPKSRPGCLHKFEPKHPIQLTPDVEIPNGIYEAVALEQFKRVKDRSSVLLLNSQQQPPLRKFSQEFAISLDFFRYMACRDEQDVVPLRHLIETKLRPKLENPEEIAIQLTWAPILKKRRYRKAVHRFTRRKLSALTKCPICIHWKCDNAKAGNIVPVRNKCIEKYKLSDDGTVVGSERT